MKYTHIALVSNTGVGEVGMVVEFGSIAELESKTQPGDFARVSYTNLGAHPRTHSGIPCRPLRILPAISNSDWLIETPKGTDQWERGQRLLRALQN